MIRSAIVLGVFLTACGGSGTDSALFANGEPSEGTGGATSDPQHVTDDAGVGGAVARATGGVGGAMVTGTGGAAGAAGHLPDTDAGAGGESGSGGARAATGGATSTLAGGSGGIQASTGGTSASSGGTKAAAGGTTGGAGGAPTTCDLASCATDPIPAHAHHQCSLQMGSSGGWTTSCGYACDPGYSGPGCPSSGAGGAGGALGTGGSTSSTCPTGCPAACLGQQWCAQHGYRGLTVPTGCGPDWAQTIYCQ